MLLLSFLLALSTSAKVLLPEYFHAAENWPECADIIRNVRDQGKCGSCWAVSGASVISDRICIASGGKSKVVVSAQEIVSCAKNAIPHSDSNGCHGGLTNDVLIHWSTTGVVSESCQPYEPGNPCKANLCSCAEYLESNSSVCKNECRSGVQPKRYFGSKMYNVSSDDYKAEIMKNGPIQIDMMVFDDLEHHTTGIYSKISEKMVMFHNVKLVGWGKDEGSGQDYWIIANTWGNYWGEQGFFQMSSDTFDHIVSKLTSASTPKAEWDHAPRSGGFTMIHQTLPSVLKTAVLCYYVSLILFV